MVMYVIVSNRGGSMEEIRDFQKLEVGVVVKVGDTR